jgi:DHA1 family tetracycline resistance protein-like MFS transporter
MALWGLANPSAQGLMSRRIGAHERGRLQGAIASLMGVSNLIGPGLFTQTFACAIGAAGGSVPGAVSGGGGAARERHRGGVAGDERMNLD